MPEMEAHANERIGALTVADCALLHTALQASGHELPRPCAGMSSCWASRDHRLLRCLPELLGRPNLPAKISPHGRIA